MVWTKDILKQINIQRGILSITTYHHRNKKQKVWTKDILKQINIQRGILSITTYHHRNKKQKVWTKDILKQINIQSGILNITKHHTRNKKVEGLDKRNYKIDQHLARHFKYNGACLSNPPPFLYSQIIISFSNSTISTNQETGL